MEFFVAPNGDVLFGSLGWRCLENTKQGFGWGVLRWSNLIF